MVKVSQRRHDGTANRYVHLSPRLELTEPKRWAPATACAAICCRSIWPCDNASGLGARCQRVASKGQRKTANPPRSEQRRLTRRASRRLEYARSRHKPHHLSGSHSSTCHRPMFDVDACDRLRTTRASSGSACLRRALRPRSRLTGRVIWPPQRQQGPSCRTEVRTLFRRTPVDQNIQYPASKSPRMDCLGLPHFITSLKDTACLRIWLPPFVVSLAVVEIGVESNIWPKRPERTQRTQRTQRTEGAILRRQFTIHLPTCGSDAEQCSRLSEFVRSSGHGCSRSPGCSTDGLSLA